MLQNPLLLDGPNLFGRGPRGRKTGSYIPTWSEHQHARPFSVVADENLARVAPCLLSKCQWPGDKWRESSRGRPSHMIACHCRWPWHTKSLRLPLAKCILNPSCAADLTCVIACSGRPDESTCQQLAWSLSLKSQRTMALGKPDPPQYLANYRPRSDSRGSIGSIAGTTLRTMSWWSSTNAP